MGTPTPFTLTFLEVGFDYSFTTGLFAKLFAQWNADTNVVSTNFLINYIYRPGSDFYFVFNQTYDTNGTTKISFVRFNRGCQDDLLVESVM